jgi:hypothetical protein
MFQVVFLVVWRSCATWSLPRWLEISQIRRRLIFSHRHQIAVGAQEIILAPLHVFPAS